MRKRTLILLVLSAFVLSLVPQAAFPAVSYAYEFYANVEDFGANGHDSVDDMDAIQRGIDAVCDPANTAYYGKPLYFPAGTYLVSPTSAKGSEKWLTIRSGLHITGDGISSTIKVKDNAGDYGYLFACPKNSAGQWETIGDFTFSNIKIDQNGYGNTTCDIGYSIATNAQDCFFMKAFGIGRWERVTFDYSGVNCLYLADGKASYVTNCDFEFNAANHQDFDTSALYLCNNQQICVGNRFYSDIEDNAKGGIETHVANSVISNNVFENFNTGINVVGQNEETAGRNNDFTITGNTIRNANSGIGLWSITGTNLNNCTIANNTISLDTGLHKGNTSSGIHMAYQTTGLSGSYNNVNIIGNTIAFMKDTEKRDFAEASCGAIYLCPNGDVSNVNVSNNMIYNAPLKGITVGINKDTYTFKNIAIKNNMIVNAGSYEHASIRDYRSAIFLLGKLENIFVEGNLISDTNEEFGGYSSIYVNTGMGIKNINIKNNDIVADQGGYYWAVPNHPEIHLDAPFKTFYSSQFPIVDKMTLNVGDIIYNTGTLTPGASYTGYRVTVAGTTGKLSNVTGDVEAQSDTITVSDSSNIKPGDYLDVAGVGVNIKVLRVYGNKVQTNRKFSSNVTGAAVSFTVPTYKAFGQLSRT